MRAVLGGSVGVLQVQAPTPASVIAVDCQDFRSGDSLLSPAVGSAENNAQEPECRASSALCDRQQMPLLPCPPSR